MKILITCETYFPYVGGVSTTCQHIAEGLARRHSVTIATGYLPDRVRNELNNVKIVDFKINYNLAIGIKGEKTKYIDFLKSWDGDIMLNFAAQCWSTDLAMINLNNLRYKKVLVPVGYSGLTGGLKMRIIYWLYFMHLPKYLKLYDEFIYLSPNYADSKFNRSKGIMGGVVIGNGIDVKEFLDAQSINFRNKYNINTPYMLLTVSNHESVKRHEFIIGAFLKLKNSDTTLVIISSQEKGCFSKCLSASERSGGRIRLLTGIPRLDVISAYLVADIFLLGSKLECFPVVIVEAMGAGLPFVSTPCGNVPELPGGIIVKDTNEMSSAIEQLLKDKDYRVMLGETGRKHCYQYFTWERIVEKYEDLIMRVCNS